MAFLSNKEITDDVVERVLELNRDYSKQIKSSSQFAKEIVFKKKMKNVKKIKKVGDRIFKNTFENLNMIINHET